MNETPDRILYAPQPRAFMATAAPDVKAKILHEIGLIARGLSCDYIPVRNPALKIDGLDGAYRLKIMSVERDHGGVRVIFHKGHGALWVAVIRLRDDRPYDKR